MSAINSTLARTVELKWVKNSFILTVSLKE
uniref:Uncharacterized protein n=1 Tax=Siphoviridae sp. ctGMq5 TaxID=2826220 RepID=A0A8S5NMA8_9CAUD|nr:MAG TPA: hypothetical protein [Siphoviridae sp. ctGMq5]